MATERTVPEINPLVERYLEEYLALGAKFVNPPKVKLQLGTSAVSNIDVNDRDVAITTAVQCYSPGLAVMKPRRDEKSKAIADSTLEAGHLTTRQHTQYTWRVEGSSRLVQHEVTHASPYYNSETQSQRYVEVAEGNYLDPAGLTPEQTEVYKTTADFSNRAYFELLDLVAPEIDKRIHDMYPQSGWKVGKTAQRLNDKAIKIGQEVARYVIPVGQKSNEFLTLSKLQLLRLFRATQMSHFSDEAKYVVGQMIKTVGDLDSSIYEELRAPIAQRPEGVKQAPVRSNKEAFDKYIKEGEYSHLVSIPENARAILAEGVRAAVNVSEEDLTDEAALDMLWDPAVNTYLADVYDSGMYDPLTSALRLVSVTYLTRMSFIIDSQRQRHRMTPGVTAPFVDSYDGTIDYMTPMVIAGNPQLKAKYDSMMNTIYQGVEQCIAAGIPKDIAVMLLPNAHTVRVIESGDLFDWFHRFKLRLCYLAQEEISFATIEQAQQLIEHIPEAEKALMAPCGVRRAMGLKPRCPEGERFCGIPVFNLPLGEYKEKRLI